MTVDWAKRANVWLLIATIVFFAAATMSGVRMLAAQRALFWNYRTGTWLVAEAQTEFQRTVISSRDFRIAPSSARLDALKVQFEVLWSRIPLILESAEGSEIRDIPTVLANARRIAAELPKLEQALAQADPATASSLDAFDAELGMAAPLFDEMIQTVLVRDEVRDRANSVLRGQKLTLFAFGVSVVTGFALILGNLVQTRRVGRLYRNVVASRQEQATKLMAIEASGDGIVMFDGSGIIEYSNEALRRLVGARIDRDLQISGSHWRRFVHPDSVAELARAIAELPADGYWTGELRGLTLYGVASDWDVTVMRRSEGGFIAVVRDLASRKAVEEQKHILQDQLHRAQKMEAIGVLTGGVAHDFNNILAAITGYGALLLEDLKGQPAAARMAQQILIAAGRGAELVRSMLAFSKPDQADFSAVDFGTICREAANMAASSVRSAATFEVEIDDRPMRVMGDPTQIERAIVNLCVNARDAVKSDGVVRLTVASTAVDGGCADGLHKFAADISPQESKLALQEAGDNRRNAIRFQKLDGGRSRGWIGALPGKGNYVRVRVSDNGTGIPFAVLERMFDPFFTTKEVGRGTGLGLSSVLGVVAAHQGAIAVDTTMGMGTTVDLIFPLADAAAATRPAPKPADPAADAGFKPAARQILVVDDDAAAGSAMTMILERLGCEPVFCQDPVEALAAVGEDLDCFSLVITDLTMPHMSGIELAGKMRDAGYRGHIALATGKPLDISDSERRHINIVHAIKKPFGLTAITETLRMVDRLDRERAA